MAKVAIGGQNWAELQGKLIVNTLPIGQMKQRILIIFLMNTMRAVMPMKMGAHHVAHDNSKE
eukprot:scaffold31101_cov171-Skeletonema_menzelii.AAC.1